MRSGRVSAIFRRAVPVWLLVLLVASSAFATALVIMSLPTQRVGLWSGQVAPTDFTITEFDVKYEGPHKIVVTVTVKNTDSKTHSAEVTVQLLDSQGNVILEETKATGDVAAGGTWTGEYVFVKTNLVSEYDRPFVVIEQLS